MTELDVKYLQEENDKLKRENHALCKNIEEMHYRLDECQNKNNQMKSKLSAAEQSEYRIPGYKNERCKLIMENRELHDTIGVLSEEITRLRQIIKNGNYGGIQSNI